VTEWKEYSGEDNEQELSCSKQRAATKDKQNLDRDAAAKLPIGEHLIELVSGYSSVHSGKA